MNDTIVPGSGYNNFQVRFPLLGSGRRPAKFLRKGVVMLNLPLYLWNDDSGQDIAEYAVMLAVILVLVVGTIRLVGSNANNAFSSVSSTLQ
jgi:Flp pilus assembly pilin Flp